MVHAVIEIKNLLETGFRRLVFTLHPVIALVELGFEGGAVGLGALLLDGGGGINQVLSARMIKNLTYEFMSYFLLFFFLFLLGLHAQIAGKEAGELLEHLRGHLCVIEAEGEV